MTITRSGTKGVEMVWKMGNFSTPRFENSTMQLLSLLQKSLHFTFLLRY